ncbi:putative alpha-ketoglutarate-dependent taurine dioxygenase [Phaeomoniella chlamydospora]|uniref:Putative alpha-ketoglutarate-dependent taurine dioxygenase n=1 Tax=Phaeomoniella chlamydospora TaxID=158046 RepID=A0A0G2GJA6_PHACM|nr:putative alpha-ketoglutarate-dependent taurine dioxygenase [Phaeomoniella chlamydospora]
MPSLATFTPTTSDADDIKSNIRGGHRDARTRFQKPLVNSGSLDRFKYSDLTPVIGREYLDVQVADLLAGDEQLIKDLAITISERGVVFLRNQDVSPQQMRELCQRITASAGCPESSGLHVHPLTEEGSELGDQISVISSEKQKKGGGLTHQLSDLWASGYEIYDRLSPNMQQFLEGLTATHDAKFFLEEAERLGNPLRTGIRGSPLNHGSDLQAVHPVIRTNPVTGWKSVYVNKGFTKRINGVTKDESDFLLGYLFNLLTQNHDAQVRFKWNKNDLAIWDNRSNWHCATYDYEAARAGDRVCSLGEAPYLDLNSKGRREALGQ